MIAKLTGIVDELHLGHIVLNVHGVGYKVFVTGQTLETLTHAEKNEVSLHIYSAIRDTAFDLYGFITQSEQDFFELLLTISGVGPKSALAILNTAPVTTLIEGITTGDASYLSKISGIGKKSAEKIVIGLKDKLGALETESVNTEGGGLAIEALTQLGYSERDARETIQKIDKTLSAEDMIKEALKHMSQK